MEKMLFMAAAVLLGVLTAQSQAEEFDIEKILTTVIENPDTSIGDLAQGKLSEMETSDSDLDLLSNIELDEDGVLGGCRNGKCNFCTRINFVIKKVTVCFTAAFLKARKGFLLVLKINGKTIKKEISVAKPPPVCFGGPGFLKKLGSICVKLDNVNIPKRHACIYVEFSMKLFWKRKSYRKKIKCFTIPIENEDNKSLMIESDDVDEAFLRI